MSNNIYKRTAAYVTALYEAHAHPNLLFHTLEHTSKVVARAEEIAAHYQLSEKEMLILYVAAWFHDTGHLFSEINGHEAKSIELMEEFIRTEELQDIDIVGAVAECIRATKMPHDPKNRLEEIMCDADTYHFGTKEFKATNKLVKREMALRGYANVADDWIGNTIELLEHHKYYTAYCQVLLEERKRKNMEWLRNRKQARASDNVHHSLFTPELDNVKNVKTKNSLMARGIQTMFRLTSENHFHLSELADRKANILISVNSIMISVILGFLVRRLSDSPHLTIPSVVFLVSSLATIILAILATRPKITEGKFQREDILNKKTNLIFFGNFYKSTLEEYEWAMSTLMRDNEYLYSVLVKDIHQTGVVLGRKYKLVRLAYTTFMVGLTISVITFFVASIVHASSMAASPPTVKDAMGSPF